MFGLGTACIIWTVVALVACARAVSLYEVRLETIHVAQTKVRSKVRAGAMTAVSTGKHGLWVGLAAIFSAVAVSLADSEFPLGLPLGALLGVTVAVLIGQYRLASSGVEFSVSAAYRAVLDSRWLALGAAVIGFGAGFGVGGLKLATFLTLVLALAATTTKQRNTAIEMSEERARLTRLWVRVTGLTEKAILEGHSIGYDDNDQPFITPFPPSLAGKQAEFAERVAEFYPDVEVGLFDPTSGIKLVAVSEAEQSRRDNLANSGGLFETDEVMATPDQMAPLPPAPGDVNLSKSTDNEWF